LVEADGTTREWRNRTLPAYKRLTKQAEALIAGTYLAGTNTRRVRRALGALFGGAVGKDTVSRAWRKVQGDWEAWQKRDLSQDDIIRVILDGTVVKVRLDKRSTGISVLVALGATARRFFSVYTTWAARAKRRGAPSWTIWSPASSPPRTC
jgi:transposase-like protein